MQPATSRFHTERLLHIIQRRKKYLIPNTFRWQFIFTRKEPGPVDIEIETIGWWLVFVGMKTQVSLVLAISASPPQAQSKCRIQNTPGNLPELLLEFHISSASSFFRQGDTIKCFQRSQATA